MIDASHILDEYDKLSLKKESLLKRVRDSLCEELDIIYNQFNGENGKEIIEALELKYIETVKTLRQIDKRLIEGGKWLTGPPMYCNQLCKSIRDKMK